MYDSITNLGDSTMLNKDKIMLIMYTVRDTLEWDEFVSILIGIDKDFYTHDEWVSLYNT